MLKRLLQWIRDRMSREESELDRKKKDIENLISKSGIEWKDVEGTLFWDTPLISFPIYLVFVGLFWKFISYELQRIALIILLASGLTIVSEIRKLIAQTLIERCLIDIKPENKRLGFDLNDVINVSAQGWLLAEGHYIYLLRLKEEKDPTLIIHLVAYLSFLMTLFKYIPVVEVLFISGTFLYFYPVLIYLGVIEKLFERLERMIRPLAMHWVNTQTKRTRNRIRKIDSKRRNETDDEEFFPHSTHHHQGQRRYEIPSHESVDSDSTEEFDPRRRIYKNMNEGNSSDYDEDSFIPNYNSKKGVASYDNIPSLSQYDSMMEPLDDEFHAGLDFDNVSARSYSDFGIPDEFKDQLKRQTGEDTDDDIDLIPADDFPDDQIDAELRYASIVPNPNLPNSKAGNSHQTEIRQRSHHQHQQQEQPPSIKQDQEFELLDKRELQDVTDEEINEQNIGRQGRAPDIIKGVSNMLGY